MTRFLPCFAALLTFTVGSQMANAAVVFTQDFETDTSGWFDDDDNAGYGDISQVASGTNGIMSKSGSYHALVTDDTPNGATAGDTVGPFTRFDGYRSEWPGGMTASLDIYLDANWTAGEGFDYSVAANGSDGNHQRDFIFHVTKDISTGMLLVGGSNNSSNALPREDLESLNYYEVANSGWYTFEHDFYDAGDGTLAVDLNLRDDVGNLLFTETRNSLADILATEVGGNRYGWFTLVNVDGGIAVDNASLSAVPEPGSLALCTLGGLFGTAVYLRCRWA